MIINTHGSLVIFTLGKPRVRINRRYTQHARSAGFGPQYHWGKKKKIQLWKRVHFNLK